MRILFFLLSICSLTFGQSPLQRVMTSQGEETSNTGYVDYTTNMVEEWIVNRKLVINSANTGIEYIQGTNGNFRMLVNGGPLLTSNNELTTTTLGDGLGNALDTEITNGFGFTGDISIVYYVKKTAAHSAIQILWDSANGNSSTNPLFQFQTQISGANLNMQFSYNAVNYPLTGQQFPYDANYHVVVVRARNDAGTIKLSVNIDGTQRGSEQSVTGSMTNWDAKIARRHLRSSTTTWFGSVKRIRIYKQWLSDTDVVNLNASNAVFKRTEVETKDEWVVACWGQSNWLGEPFSTTSELTPSDRQQQIPNTNFFGDVTTRLLNGPLLSEVRPALGPGPVIELGYQLKTKYPNKNFYVISVAASNTGMASYWNSRSSGTGWLEYSRQLTNLLIKLKAEGRTISTVAICDYQGETDASTTTDANNFETNRGNFYDDASTIITGQFASATIKIQLGRISSGLNIGSYPGRDIVRTAISNLAGARANISIINSDDLNLGWIGGDGTHYQTTQLQTIGARIATQLWVIPFFIVPFRRKKNIKLWKEYSNRLAA